MRPRLPSYLFAALTACVLLFEAAWAQVLPFGGNVGPGLSPEDNHLLFESVARLNAAEPSRVGLSEARSNPQTRTSGTSTIIRVSTQAAWLAIWCAITSSLSDRQGLATTGSPGAARRPESGR